MAQDPPSAPPPSGQPSDEKPAHSSTLEELAAVLARSEQLLRNLQELQERTRAIAEAIAKREKTAGKP
jgi:hypothetical protein